MRDLRLGKAFVTLSFHLLGCVIIKSNAERCEYFFVNFNLTYTLQIFQFWDSSDWKHSCGECCVVFTIISLIQQDLQPIMVKCFVYNYLFLFNLPS